MGNRDILAIGASAGGVEALLKLARTFSPDLPASVLVTLHLSSQFRSSLDEVLTRAGPLTAGFAADGERLRKGRIYIAPPDRHLLIDGERIALGVGPAGEQFAAGDRSDVAFRGSVLRQSHHRRRPHRHARRRRFGALGSQAMRRRHRSAGPARRGVSGDAANRAELAQPDHVVDLEHMPALLDSLVRQPAGEPTPAPSGMAFEVRIAKGEGGYVMTRWTSSVRAPCCPVRTAMA